MATVGLVKLETLVASSLLSEIIAWTKITLQDQSWEMGFHNQSSKICGIALTD